MERAKTRSRSAVLRYIAAILFGVILGGCGAVLISRPIVKEYLKPIFLTLVGLALFLIGLLLVLRIYLRSRTSAWSSGRVGNLISLVSRFVLAPEERAFTKEQLVAEVTEGASLLMSVLAVAQAMASLLVLLGTFVAVATLATSYMQVERLDAQNSLIKDQNSYFRDQLQELRKQVKIQDEQGDLVRRKDLLETIYDGKERGVSTRIRVEALEALVRLDNKLIDQRVIPGPMVDLRGVDFSCEVQASEDCADFGQSWLARTNFDGSNFTGASFLSSDLRDSSFVSADLSDANMRNAHLEGTQFRGGVPIPIWMEIDRGMLGAYHNSGLTERMFRELLRLKNVAQGLNARNKLVRQEFALERLPLSQDVVDFMNSAARAARVEGASFEVDSGYRKLDIYTRLPLGLLSGQTGSVDEIFARIDKIQMKADEVYGLYDVNIDMGGKFPGAYGDYVTCSRSGNFKSSKISLDAYERMSAEDQEIFLVMLCRIEPVRIRSSLPFFSVPAK